MDIPSSAFAPEPPQRPATLYGVASTEGFGVGARGDGGDPYAEVSGSVEAVGSSSGARVDTITNLHIGDGARGPLTGTLGITTGLGYDSKDKLWASIGARAGVESHIDNRFMLGAFVGVDAAISRRSRPFGAYAGVEAGMHF